MSSKETIKLQLCVGDRGDGANGDMACSVKALRSCTVYNEFLISVRLPCFVLEPKTEMLEFSSNRIYLFMILLSEIISAFKEKRQGNF